MKVAVIDFPGTNRVIDTLYALGAALNTDLPNNVSVITNQNDNLDDYELIVIAGGFSYGDHLRAGAIAAKTELANEIIKQANKGKYILGICNGFQILTEIKLLPGTLMTNLNQRFICDQVFLKVVNIENRFLSNYKLDQVIKVPVAHMQGNYYASDDTLQSLVDNQNIVLRYCDKDGNYNKLANKNGSKLAIAGIKSNNGRILGMMPHFENATSNTPTGNDGLKLFQSIFQSDFI